MAKEAEEFSLSSFSLPVNVGLQKEVMAALEEQPRSPRCVFECALKTPVPLCSVLHKVFKSWQAISAAGQALPAALTVKAMNSLFVPPYQKTLTMPD